MATNITLLILAAGMGSRYEGLKQLESVGPMGETIMEYSIYDALQAGFNKIVFIIRQSFEDTFKEVFINKISGKTDVAIALQSVDDIPAGININKERQKPWGTVHAIWSARNHIAEPFAMINADDFYGRNAFKGMARFLKGKTRLQDTHYAMCGYNVENTLSPEGSVTRAICGVKNNFLETVEEHTDVRIDEQGFIKSRHHGKEYSIAPGTPVSMNIWGFTQGIFPLLDQKLIEFLRKNASDLYAECYIPVVVSELIRNHQAIVEVLQCNSRWFGMTYKADKGHVMRNIHQLVKTGEYPPGL
jgi:choline kinase